MARSSAGITDNGFEGAGSPTRDELAEASSFLQRQTFGSILVSTFGIYFGRWWTVFLIYIFPLAPIAAIHAVLVDRGANLLATLIYIFMLMVSMLLGAALVVSISDICLGLKPTVRRSYHRAFSSGKLIGSYLMALGAVFGGFLLLIIPGMVFGAWYMFVLPVVVLEQLSGRMALRRSRELGKDSYLRNFAVLFGIGMMLTLLVDLFMIVLVMLAPLAFGPFVLHLARVIGEVMGVAILAPLISIPVILLYYDMRARKDNYGAAQLAEDLRI